MTFYKPLLARFKAGRISAPVTKTSNTAPANSLWKHSSNIQSGQVIIEYILLLVVTVGIATIIVKQLVSKNPDSPGALMTRWHAIQLEIGKDDPNKSK